LAAVIVLSFSFVILGRLVSTTVVQVVPDQGLGPDLDLDLDLEQVDQDPAGAQMEM